MDEDNELLAKQAQVFLQQPFWEYIVAKLEEAIKYDEEALTDPNHVVNTDEVPESKRLRYKMLIHLKMCKYLLNLPHAAIEAVKDHTVVPTKIEEILD